MDKKKALALGALFLSAAVGLTACAAFRQTSGIKLNEEGTRGAKILSGDGLMSKTIVFYAVGPDSEPVEEYRHTAPRGQAKKIMRSYLEHGGQLPDGEDGSLTDHTPQ